MKKTHAFTGTLLEYWPDSGPAGLESVVFPDAYHVGPLAHLGFKIPHWRALFRPFGPLVRGVDYVSDSLEEIDSNYFGGTTEARF